MLRRSDDLARLSILDEKGNQVVLGSLWRERTAVIALVRHFGCLFCREQVTELARSLDRIHGAGAELHVISNGQPMYIEAFRDTTRFRGPVYTDPSLTVYKAAQLRRGIESTLNPAMLLHAVRALRAGHRLSRPQGDVQQMGGVLVITPAGDVRFHYISSTAGDHPEIDDVISA